MHPSSPDGIKRLLVTGVIPLLETLVIGQIVQQLTLQPLLVLMDFVAIKPHVHLHANQVTLQLAEEEQNAERTRKLENGSGKINWAVVKPVQLKHQ